ncbi:MAG: hypothetical protein R2764_23540 [Bacteroidales bacterium]
MFLILKLFLGAEKLNPVIDKGETIYADIYDLLVDALVRFQCFCTGTLRNKRYYI